ncbi:MAG: response regulator [Candidatus Binatia bacterium]
MPIRLVLADDHPLILDGLGNLFRLEPDVHVLACCRTGEDTLRAVRQHCPDVLLLDICMPGKDGLAVLRELQNEQLLTRVVVLTAALGDHVALEALRLGVKGIILKEMASQLIVQCIRKVHAGGQWFERDVTGRAVDTLLRREAGACALARVLTVREREIIQFVAEGLRNRDIATKLFISEGTVKLHLHHIYEKLHLDGRFALVRYAQDQALV